MEIPNVGEITMFLSFFSQGPTFWVNYGATEACSPEPWNHGLDLEEPSPHDRTIQVSELY